MGHDERLACLAKELEAAMETEQELRIRMETAIADKVSLKQQLNVFQQKNAHDRKRCFGVESPAVKHHDLQQQLSDLQGMVAQYWTRILSTHTEASS